jgi:hypothetical protein
MDRVAALAALIAFDRPLGALQSTLDALPLENAPAPLAVVRRKDIESVIRRFLARALSEADVEIWAELVECRDDVEFEPRHEEAVADALYDLANPESRFEDVANDVLARLA